MIDATEISAEPEVASTATSVVLNHVRQAIRAGKLQPGQRVRERELALACSVSRSAIREALMMLVAEGTLMREHGHSAVVRQFTREEVWAHHQIREALEGLAAGLAASRHDQVRYHQALRGIGSALREHAAAGDGEAYLEANYLFHALVVEMSANPFIQTHINLTHATQLRMQAARFIDREGMKSSLKEHEAIIAAILEGNPQLAESTMRAHIRGTRRTFIDMPDTLFRPSA